MSETAPSVLDQLLTDAGEKSTTFISRMDAGHLNIRLLAEAVAEMTAAMHLIVHELREGRPR